MQTLKSACLVVVLLGVLYGVFIALNKPDFINTGAPPPQAPDPLSIDYGGTSPGGYAPPTIPASSPVIEPVSNVDAPDRSARGNSLPNLDTGSMPPPSPSTYSTGLQRSAYEAPINSPAAPSVYGAVPTSVESAAPPLSPVAPATTPPVMPSPALAAYDLKRDMADVEEYVAAGKFKSALARLTPHYSNEDLADEQRRQVVAWLDALAAKVIYSREHFLAPAHVIRKGEDLYQIAQQYNVDYRLLQNINSEITDPLVLVAGTEIKVVSGPFHAHVKLSANEVTLYVGDLYAGRFSFVLGDQPPQPGEYKVADKRWQQKTYVGFDGRVIPANDPANPYGECWISLGGEVAIHGSPLTVTSQSTLGCISLSPQDAKDVFSILSLGSKVVIEQ